MFDLFDAFRGRISTRRAIVASITQICLLSGVVGYLVAGALFGEWSPRAAIVALLIPLVVAPPFIISRFRLTDQLRRGQRELEERSRELAGMRDQLSEQLRQLRRAEEQRQIGQARYLAVLDGAIQGACVHRSFRPIYCNAAFARMFGFGAPAEVLALDSILGLFAPEVHEAMRAEDEALKAAVRISSQVRERPALRRDGSALWVETLASVIEWDDGPAIRISAIDVTERHALDDLKNEFISVVSHELRTPLTSIKGSLDLVTSGMAGSTSPQVGNLVGIARANSERLLRLVNDILDFERIESDGVLFHPRALSTLECLQQAVRENAGFAETAGCPLELIQPDTDLWVFADPDRLQQVLTNLVSNALKFSPKGQVVHLSVVPGASGRVRFQVSDRGPGIAPEFRSRIFRKFSRFDAANARGFQGSGLGLSITKALVEKQGGSIGFHSRHGGGTTFFVDLPPPSPHQRHGLPVSPQSV